MKETTLAHLITVYLLKVPWALAVRAERKRKTKPTKSSTEETLVGEAAH